MAYKRRCTMTLWITVADFPGWEKSYMNIFYNKKKKCFFAQYIRSKAVSSAGNEFNKRISAIKLVLFTGMAKDFLERQTDCLF